MSLFLLSEGREKSVTSSLIYLSTAGSGETSFTSTLRVHTEEKVDYGT